ncbi:MAG: hypothetical protein QG574_4904 [Cyanobacteriota bacterium erpe_2018_sw_21hr_WHONDRS-SW48-000092_B_bin.40]|nr:hypothetical protein [Cyanobacteriota bacterium erpe_2018_sw_21hr_WHONDRS-SW48-000092_B_bin.40]
MQKPFLKHVDETTLRDLQDRLEENGKLSSNFLFLLAGSTMIATFGLFQNSPAVIIGAMIIAPLMRPLVCMSLATITADTRQIFKALLTLIVGTLVGMAISTCMALFLRALELTPEIIGRTHPTLLDLGVALAAGAVGAYCQTNAKLSDTLAGVAIAVALVPPLSVVGIGLAFGSPEVSSGAALLYATNLVGITIAGALVFLVKGFSPLQLARRGLSISAGCIALLVVPLAFSMRELILENQISSKIRTVLKEKTVTFREAQLREVKVLRFKAPMSVQATIIGSGETITSNQVKLVQDLLTKEIGSALQFKLRIIPATEVTALEVSTTGEQKVITPPEGEETRESRQIESPIQPETRSGQLDGKEEGTLPPRPNGKDTHYQSAAGR